MTPVAHPAAVLKRGEADALQHADAPVTGYHERADHAAHDQGGQGQSQEGERDRGGSVEVLLGSGLVS
jgi:hypothetical protein